MYIMLCIGNADASFGYYILIFISKIKEKDYSILFSDWVKICTRNALKNTKKKNFSVFGFTILYPKNGNRNRRFLEREKEKETKKHRKIVSSFCTISFFLLLLLPVNVFVFLSYGM